MEKDFLHKINLDALQKEVNKGIVDIGKLVEMKNPKGVYKWAKSQDENGSRPSYNALIKLLEEGASVETLFGVEYRKKSIGKIGDEFREGMELSQKPMTKDEVIALFKSMKENGEL